MDASKRAFLTGVGSAGLLIAARSLGQTPTPQRAGADGGGIAPPSDPYPNGYVVKAPAVASGQPTFATVQEGRLQGVQSGMVRYFRAIPYAAPPTGDRRFRPPEAVQPWSGVRMAVENPPAAMQNNLIAEAPTTSEDCLYLNIWAPTSPGPHPVYVYIHGGANTSGYSLEHRVQGANFARDGIVCVNIGYRLGALGFLELGGLLGKDFVGTGNNALRDQLFALHWVQKNIAAFGGDPKLVTIGGQSAGGFDVISLTASPLSQGLFRGAISQSGSGHGTCTMDEAHTVADKFAAALQAAGARVENLPSMPVEQILAAQRVGMRDGQNNGVIDGALLLEHPYEALRKGRGAAVRMMMGSNRDELAVLGGPPNPQRFDAAHQEALAKYRALQPKLPESELLLQFGSDELMGASTRICADSHAAAGGAAYVYRWDWAAETGKLKGKAFHGIETPFAWDNLASIAFRYVVPEPKLQPRADTIHRLWTSFIRDGEPTAPGVGAWSRWSPGKRDYLLIADDYRMARCTDAQMAVWSGVLNT